MWTIFNKGKRYESHQALKHPWITRSLDCQIPLTLFESTKRLDQIKLFSTMIMSALFLPMLKAKFLIKKSINKIAILFIDFL